MKLYPNLFVVFLLFFEGYACAQSPVITPNPQPVLLPLNANQTRIIQGSDIANITGGNGLPPIVTYTPSGFNCKSLGAQTVTIHAVNDVSADISTPQNASFYRPQVIAFDKKGDLFVGEDGHSIRKIDLNGNVTQFAGSDTYIGFIDGKGTDARFNSVLGMVIDDADNLFIIDGGNNAIRQIDPAGNVTTIAGNGQIGSDDGKGGNARFNAPEGITIDRSGNMYVTCYGDHSVRKVTPDGTVTTVAGSGTPGYIDGKGTAASFNYPSGICVDPSGNLYVADINNFRIRKIDPDGMVSTYAGSVGGEKDGTLKTALFLSPISITIDAADNLYVYDSKIRKITPDGSVISFVGTGNFGYADGPAQSASFGVILGFAYDAYGVLHAADPLNSRIRKICPDGFVSTIAGDGGLNDRDGNIGVFNSPNCPVEAQVQVVVTDPQGSCGVKPIANTFTPNGDNINDFWDIPLLISYPRCTVNIYDRYGQQVFQSVGYGKPWDGIYMVKHFL